MADILSSSLAMLLLLVLILFESRPVRSAAIGPARPKKVQRMDMMKEGAQVNGPVGPPQLEPQMQAPLRERMVNAPGNVNKLHQFNIDKKDDGAGRHMAGVQALGGAGNEYKDKQQAANGPEPIDALLRRRGPIGAENLKDNNLPLKSTKKADFKLTKLDIKPPDHLEAVRLHHDGDLNLNYKREIFLGIDDHHGQVAEGDAEAVLEKIFTLADVNADKFLSIDEMANWIVKKIDEHFKEAKVENKKIFQALDSDSDGFITWPEFRDQYLQAMGYKLLPDRVVEQQGVANAYHLTDSDMLNLSNYEGRWGRSDARPEDQRLSVSEFQSFRHPELNTDTLNEMVDELMASLDHDHNGIITEDEFAALPLGEVAEEFKKFDLDWQEERRQEYRKLIDVNHDGQTDVAELRLYVDPQNRSHARLEAENLVGLTDTNGDNKLSLDEMLHHSNTFLGSKMVNTGKNFHDEF